MDDKDLCMMFGELKGLVKSDNENFEKKIAELQKTMMTMTDKLDSHNEFITNFKTDMKWVRRIAGTVSALVSIIMTVLFNIYSMIKGSGV